MKSFHEKLQTPSRVIYGLRFSISVSVIVSIGVLHWFHKTFTKTTSKKPVFKNDKLTLVKDGIRYDWLQGECERALFVAFKEHLEA